MFNIKISTQLFILLALCGILIVCFINIDSPINKINTVNAITPSVEPFQSDVTTTTLSVQQQIANQVSTSSIINYKKKLNALFAATNSPVPTSSNQAKPALKEAYLNELTVQTLPKTNPDDIIVTYFYFRNGAPSANSSALDQLIDFVLTEKADRAKDFFLRADSGITINILFKYNFKNDFNDVVDVEAVVTETPPVTRVLTESEKARYKALTFDKCEIDYITANTLEYIKLTLKKSKIITDYIPPAGASNTDSISGTKEVLQEFIIYLRINELSSKLNSDTNTLELTLADFIPFDSYLEYKVSMRIGSASTYTNYLAWQMYIKNASSSKVSANDFLRERLTLKQKELLHDKYNEIITPMFMVDNKISNLENSINIIKDTYNFNKLNNMANNIRFYPVTQ
jgi:hypothetical protein